MLVMRFIHLLAMCLWIGGACAALIVGRVAPDAGETRQFAARLISGIHGWVIAPGAIVTVLSGLMLTMSMTNRGMSSVLMQPGVAGMQVLGFVAGVLAVFIGTPTANQVATLVARGDPTLERHVQRLRRRESLVSIVAGGLAVLALFLGVVIR